MPIYNVEITVNIPVYADSPEWARIIARENLEEEMSNGEYEIFAEEIKTSADIPEEFKGCIPWGVKEEKEIEHYFTGK